MMGTKNCQGSFFTLLHKLHFYEATVVSHINHSSCKPGVAGSIPSFPVCLKILSNSHMTIPVGGTLITNIYTSSRS